MHMVLLPGLKEVIWEEVNLFPQEVVPYEVLGYIPT